MTETEPNPSWMEASSFRQLVTLGLRFVEGEPIGFPGWAVLETDTETDEMLPTLRAACAAGFFPVASQPGAPFGPDHDGVSSGGRAFVGGFAPHSVAVRIQERAEAQGLWAMISGREEGPAVPVGLRDGTPYLILGPDAREHELEIFEDSVGPGALTELAATVFLWVVDPVWGRRDRIRGAF